MVEKKELGKFISPRRDINRPIYNWHSYKHSYSSDLVSFLLTSFKLKKNSWVLDPFCGGGTTLLTCKEKGINSKGYDILPFASFLTNVKVRNYNPEILKDIFTEIKRTKKTATVSDLPDLSIIPKAFPMPVIAQLLFLKSAIQSVCDDNDNARDFFMLGLLGILESVSNTSKTGGFLRIVEDKNISPSLIRNMFFSKIDTMISDLSNCSNTVNSVLANAEIADARDLLGDRPYDAVITSPPYPNRHDYTRIYTLELALNFISSNQEIKNIRYNTIRSHVEAKWTANSDNNYKKPPAIDTLIRQINDNGTNNIQILRMLEGYFEDMYFVLNGIKRSLKSNGKVAMVVSNVRFAGINIPVDELLLEIGAQAGLQPVDIWVVRLRGNSAQQMKKYTRVPSRESIILWSNNA
jgi:DNA modification methylase